MDSELSYNVRALKTAIAEHFASLSAQTFSRESIIKIYGKNIPFSPNTQLYKENYDKQNVSDLLEITGHVLEGAKQFCDMETSKLEEGLPFLGRIFPNQGEFYSCLGKSFLYADNVQRKKDNVRLL